MRNISIHYAIVGVQPADLLTPLLDARFRKPELALRLLAPPGAQQVATEIVSSAKLMGLDAECLDLHGAATGQNLVGQLRTIASSHARATAALNLSGVSPLFALPAASAFRDAGHGVYAIDPGSDQLHWLLHPSGTYDSFNIVDRIRLPEFLLMHGIRIVDKIQTGSSPNRALNDVAREIGRLATSSSIRALNILVNSPQPVSQPQAQALVNVLVAAGLARQARSGEVSFTGEKASKFAGGGWLECLVFDAARALFNDKVIQDLYCGVEVETADGREAEWDVAMLCNNNLFLVECKTAKPIHRNGLGVGREVLFLLENLLNLKRVSAKGMLFALAAPTDAERVIAEQAGIRIEGFQSDRRLPDRLRSWVAP